jgi:hypothetical protein
MQAIRVNFNPATQTIAPIQEATPEPWDTVCERFDNDVRRMMNVNDDQAYNALYACYDEDNQPVYYLVEEDAALVKLRQKTFLSKLGKPQP